MKQKDTNTDLVLKATRVALVILLAVGMTAASTAGTGAVTASALDVGLELEQTESVDQGANVNITTWSNNRKNTQEPNVTLELFVDADSDGQFESSEVEATRTVDLGAGAYEAWELEFANVQLSNGTYEYATRASKNGYSNWSFTNGTLTVDNTTHPSGVTMAMYSTVAGSDGELDRTDILTVVEAYIGSGEIDSLSLSRKEVLALVEYFIRN